MKNTAREIFTSLKTRPIWTLWSLLLCPFYFMFVFMAATVLGLINFSFHDFVDFIRDNT